MSKIKLTGESSGYVEISAGNAAGNNTLEAPTSGTRLVAHEGSQDVTLNGNLTVNGVLSYEDVTNIDSVGVITARDSIHVESSEDRLLYLKSTDANAYLTFEDTDSSSGFANRVGTVSDGLYFSTGGGGERLRITSDGKIGISDTSPENTLSIKNIGSFEGDANSFYLGSNFTGTGQNFSGSGKHAQRFFFNNASSNGYLRYENTGTTGNAGDSITWQERFRIRADGTIRIGGDYYTDTSIQMSLKSSTTGCQIQMHGTGTGTASSNGLRVGYNGSGGQMWLFESGYIRFATGNAERLRITSDGKVAIGFNAPAVAGLSISNSSTNRGFEFDTGSGFDSTSCIRAYDRPTTAYKSLGLTGSDIKFGINDVEKVRINTSGTLIIDAGGDAQDIQIISHSDGGGHGKVYLRGNASNESSSIQLNHYGHADYHVSAGRAGTGLFSITRTNGGSDGIIMDSAGRLMLGTTTEGFATYGDKFTIADSGHCGMTIRSGTSSYGTIYFSDGDDGSADEVRGFIDYNHSNNQLQIGTDGATRLRITSSGITQQRDLSGNYHVIASSRDGSTSARAATSAWEIKKTLGPDAKTGYYYLTNPYDSTTQQWWCDMETDGGGWILVAYNGDGQMASNPGNWYDRQHKGGFNGLTQGFYRGGGYWNTWGDLKGQLMWECRTLDTYFNSSSCSKVGINWGKTNDLPTAGTRGYGNITGNGNTLFENWCWDIYNAPGFEPSNYEQHARNNRIGGNNNFTEHMVITWSFRDTSGSADDGSSGPYWMIGAHHDGNHQHYEESLSGSDGVNGDGGYQVCSNEDTSWGGGGQQHSMNRLARHSQNGGSVFVWMR